MEFRKILLISSTLFLVVLMPLFTYIARERQITSSLASTPSQDLGPQAVKVLVMNYYPLDSTGIRLDVNETDYFSTLNNVRTKVSGLTNEAVVSMTNGTKYHGYKDSSAVPSALFQIHETKEFLKSLPKSNYQAWGNPTVRPDYRKMLTEDAAICDYVDGQGVKQVWIWGYHNPKPGGIEPDESNMSMGNKSRLFWDHGTYGDISNSQVIDDLPICENTYVLYNYSYARELGSVLEDHGHQIERMLDFIDRSFWNSKFRNPHGLTDGTINHCGWTHSPPNVTDEKQYHWSEEAVVKSDCQNWKPNGTGVADLISCHTWYGVTCIDDGGSKFKVWWMQNHPGFNNGLIFEGKEMRNWWDFYTDFDASVAAGKSLFKTISPTLTLSPTSIPSVTPTLTVTVLPTPTGVLKVGDYNLDGNIDLLDFNIWRSEFLGTSMTKKSDGNMDGEVNILDFNLWRNRFN